jgi:inorganic pyrophosphatase/exopolyphosphatase
VLDPDLKLVTLVDVEETARLGRHNDSAKVVDLADHHSIQR